MMLEFLSILRAISDFFRIIGLETAYIDHKISIEFRIDQPQGTSRKLVLSTIEKNSKLWRKISFIEEVI